MNYTYDEIIASAYLVFGEDLTTMIISMGLMALKKYGTKIKREDLKLKELKDVFEFKDYKYKLKDGYTLKSVESYLRIVLVALFEEIQKERNQEYEERCSGMSYKKVK